jgi:hypothetical protein
MNHFRFHAFGLARDTALVGLPLVLLVILALQITTFSDRLSAMGIDAPLCTTGALHNNADAADLPFIENYRVIRLLLNDAAPRFDVLSRIYASAQRVSPTVRSRPPLAKRAGRATLLQERGAASLQAQVVRIDQTRGLQLDSRINKALAEGDRSGIEGGFRQLFAELIDETLASAGNQLGQPSVARRAFQHARQMYAVSIEGYLIRAHSQAAADAARTIETMERIVESRIPGGKEVFTNERQRFIKIVQQPVAM